MASFTELHISGDLSQALAIRDSQPWIFDREGLREVSDHRVDYFFATALDIERVAPSELEGLAEEAIAERLRVAVLHFQTLHRLLVGMDGRLSIELRSEAIREADRMLRDQGVADAVAKRILRVPRGHDWRPLHAARLAVNTKSRRAADLYEVVASGILEGLEAHIWKRFGAGGLGQALEFGLIADGALAISRRNVEIIEDSAMQSPRVVSPIAEAIRRYCFRIIDGEQGLPSLAKVGAWRELSPEVTPSLEALLNDPIPAVDSRAPQQSYSGWMYDHALHRRFYVSGLAPFLKRYELSSRDAEWMTLLGPSFVVGKTSWSEAPGDWRQPASKQQFNRALRGEPLSLARAGLVIASAAAAAIDRGATPEVVFQELGLKPACFWIPTLTDELVFAMSQNDPSFDGTITVRSGRPRDLLMDVANGATVTLQTARAIREMLFSHDNPTAIGDVVGRPSKHTRGASLLEEGQAYQTVRTEKLHNESFQKSGRGTPTLDKRRKVLELKRSRAYKVYRLNLAGEGLDVFVSTPEDVEGIEKARAASGFDYPDNAAYLTFVLESYLASSRSVGDAIDAHNATHPTFPVSSLAELAQAVLDRAVPSYRTQHGVD